MADDPYKYFRVEARELSSQLQAGILQLEKADADSGIVTRLFRAAHTLKGAARVVKQREIADLAHALEDRLAPYRDPAAGVRGAPIGELLELVDRINGLVPGPAQPAPIEPAPSRASTALRTVHANITEIDALRDGLVEANAQLAAIRRELAAVARARDLAVLLCEQIGARVDARVSDARLGPGKTTAIAEELRALLTRADKALFGSVGEAERELRHARSAVDGMRLVPVSELFTAVERSAKDAARVLGKRVRVETRGGDVRLEADALGSVQAALVQLARNAAAHGIEPEAERRAAGKTSEGEIRFEVHRRGDRIAFSCRDDGKGVDLEAVRSAARRRGLSHAQAERLKSEELLRLLLRGGISTSSRIDEISGRGIGLDVVRESAERLGGTAQVGTEPGRGTWVELEIPVSLASFEALLVEASGVKAAIPLDSVRRTLRVPAGAVAGTADGHRLVFESQSIPFQMLGFALGLSASGVQARDTRPAVIVEGGSVRVGIGVDRLLGTTEAVLRPLPRHAPAHPVVMGASIDDEGLPLLVLDPDGLVAAAKQAAPSESVALSAPLPVLVIDDSLTTRMLEQSILESAGYEVEVASSAEEGLEKALRRRYGLFLVDVEMPGMDGFSFVERTRNDPVLRATPAILVTSRDAPADRARGKQVGASAYVVKSEFDQVELLDRIRSLMR